MDGTTPRPTLTTPDTASAIRRVTSGRDNY